MEFDANLLDFNLVENNEEIRKSLRDHILHSPGNWVRVFRAGMRVDPSPIFPKLDDLDRVLAERNKTLGDFFEMPLDSDFPKSSSRALSARCVAVVRCAQAARDILREGFHAPRLADAVPAIQRAFAPGEVVRSIDAVSPTDIRERFGDPRGGTDNVYEQLHSVLTPVKAAHPEWLLGPVRDLVGHFLDEGAEWNPFATTVVRSATALTGLLVLNSRQDLPVRLELTARLAESDLDGPDAWLKGFGEFYPDPVTMALLIWDAAGFQSALDAARGYCQTHHPLDPRCDVRWRIEPTDGEATTLPCRITGNSMGLAFSLGLRHLSRPGDPEIDPGIVITGAVTQTGKTAPVGGLSIKLAALERKFLAAVVPAGNKRAISSSSPRVESNVVGVGTIEEGAIKVEELGRNVRVLGKPPKPSKWFVGRTKLLNELHASFEQSPRAALFNALSGLGGIGKTETARVYVEKYVSHYGRVLWALADTENNLTGSFEKFADELGISTELDAQTRIDAVKRQLAQYSNWLLVLDNADDPTLIHEFLPHNIVCKVLVTSRASDFQILDILDPIEIEVLDPDDALELLIKRTGRENASDDEIVAAKDIARELGYLPLALEQAGAYVVDRKAGFAKYLNRFRTKRRQLLATTKAIAGQNERDAHKRSVATTWMINIEAIRDEAKSGTDVQQRNAKAALEILNLSAFLAPERIPFELLESPTIGEAVAEALPHCPTPDDLLNPLRRFSLVRVRDDETYDIHRLVQAVVQDYLSEKQQHGIWSNRAVEVLSANFPHPKDIDPDSDIVARQKKINRLMPHFIQFADGEYTSDSYWKLLFHTGLVLAINQKTQEAEAILKKSYTNLCVKYGENDARTLSVHLELGGLYSRQKRREVEAEPILVDTLNRIRDKEHSPELLVDALSSVGYFRRVQGRFPEAVELYSEAVQICNDNSFLGHKKAQMMGNLALVLTSVGRKEEAEHLYRSALDYRIKSGATNRNEIQQSKRNLGQFLKENGELTEAEELLRTAFQEQVVLLGEKAKDTLITANILAQVLTKKNEFAEAEALFKLVLTGHTEKLGPDHQNTLVSRKTYSAFLKDRGRHDEAEKVMGGKIPR